MANHASALKRNRQRIKRTARNRSLRSALRSELKSTRTVVKDTPKESTEAVKTASSKLDRAASMGVIPKKRAARLKSRLAKAAHKASKAAA